VAALVALPAVATADDGTGGAAMPASGTPQRSAPLGPPPPGIVTPRPALIRNLRCLSGCAGASTAAPAARLRVRGRNLRPTDLVVFLGAAGDADDVSAKPSKRTRTAVDVRVPLGAASGPVTVADRNGTLAAPAPSPLTIASSNAAMLRTSGALQVEADVAAPRGFFDSAIPPHVTFVVHGSQPADITVQVLRASDGVAVTSWPAGTVAPETPQTASWDGTVAGKVQKTGRYTFRVLAAATGDSAVAAQAADPDPASFVLLGHVFPVRGPHGYGGPAARFGGGRNHQGHDVFAACGTPLVAARGGTVKYKRYQSAAGHYLVIDGARTGTDYAYMHLRTPALVKEGDRVRTGQLIGYVGDTGRAEGCHLHLELWTPPGWYSGGKPIDPLPALMAWDKTS
jgi:murein DD-endopeptidase MepM/ murein hydrolase activator NlpD